MQYKVTLCSHLDVVEDYKGRSGVRSGHLHELLTVQIAAFLATFLPLWESREVLVRILVQALTCNRASPEAMAKFGSFMGKPGVPRVRVSPSARLLSSSSSDGTGTALCQLGCIPSGISTRMGLA